MSPTRLSTGSTSTRRPRTSSEATHAATHHELNSRLSVAGGEERTIRRSTPADLTRWPGLTNEEIEGIGRELRRAPRGGDGFAGADAAYIRRVIKVQRGLEIGSRVVLLFSRNKFAWVAGTAGLSLAKILENMEIGHNVLHGQWDWMRDPKIHSTTWDWDMASPAKQWQASHNVLHHTYTNVLGRDNDLGYGLLRVDEDQKWELFHLGQPIWHLINAMFFEYGIAAYDPELRGNLQNWDELSDGRQGHVQGQCPRDAQQDPQSSAPGLSPPSRRSRARASCRPCSPTSPPTRSAISGPTRSSSAGTSPTASTPSRPTRSRRDPR